MKYDFIDSFGEHLKSVSKDRLEALKTQVLRHEKIIIIGNGGSNSIASHISQDYTKFLKKKAFCF